MRLLQCRMLESLRLVGELVRRKCRGMLLLLLLLWLEAKRILVLEVMVQGMGIKAMQMMTSRYGLTSMHAAF